MFRKQMELPMTRHHRVIFILFLFCLFWVISGISFGDTIQDATVWINNGKEAFKNKDYVSAIAAYDQALLLDQFYTEGWKLRGDALLELQRYAEAADAYDRAIAIDKTNAELLGKKGRALFLLGNFQDAIDQYTRAVSLNPNLFQNQDGYGDVLTALNRFSEADYAYTNALKIQPVNNATWNKKGEVLAKMYRNKEAISAFNKSIEIYPESAEVWNSLGSVYFTMGNMQKALTAFEKAISLDESYIPQKYGDTLSRIAKDTQTGSNRISESNETPEEVKSFSFTLPPAIYILNYVMIIIGVTAIIVITVLGFVRRRTEKKEGKNQE
ncbi:hypothetical protein DLD82_00945 [Methanospirillum stamsii]|uniref:Uncharacterized protein n=2 Tax=Methanospirillum stamsii TaxID=1277351 RepID=A0A2V2NBY9_9EURY|nr:hypothetical protein DLD82_00945 [Methanospirillum stamsii]